MPSTFSVVVVMCAVVEGFRGLVVAGGFAVVGRKEASWPFDMDKRAIAPKYWREQSKDRDAWDSECVNVVRSLDLVCPCALGLRLATAA